MNALLTYLLESALCVAVLYSIYWLFLRRDTFFNVNRFYLLSAVIFSVVAPLLPIGWAPSTPSASMMILLEPVMITPEKIGKAFEAHLQWFTIVGVVYVTGIFIFLLRFGLQLIQLNRITRRFGIRNYQGRRVVFVDRSYPPFSFFHLVFINEASVPPGSLRAILEHEQVHIRQLHSLDMILIKLATILQWFNPIMWLAGREMKSIHEFLADEGVLQNGISRSSYQQMILDETMGIRVNDLTNNFNVSLLKKRIAMMTKSKSNFWAKSKVLLALPALLGLLFMFTVRSNSSAGTMNAGDSKVYNPGMLLSAPVPQEQATKEQQGKSGQVKNDKGVYTVVEKMPSYVGGDDARIKFMVENINYPEAALKKGVQGKVFVTFIVRANGSVTDVKVLRGIGSECDEEAVRVIKLMPKWNPGTQSGKPVDVQYNLPIRFALDGEKKEEPKK